MRISIIRQKSFDFSVLLIKSIINDRQNYLYKSLIDQLLRSGTSIGANIEEAHGAQSQRDFIAKMSIAYKESLETKYWLRLIKSMERPIVQYPNILITRNIELIKILTSILNTAKSNL